MQTFPLTYNFNIDKMNPIIQFIFSYPYLVGLISMLLGWAFMPIVLQIAHKKGFVVKPNKRTSHTGEIPNIGGIDIFASFMLTYIIFEYQRLPQSQFIFAGAFIIVMVGFVDDILDITPIQKTLGELLAGIALVCFGNIRITNLFGLFGITIIPTWASYALSIFVLIAIVNALNLIDGVDGLASGLGILFCAFFSVYFQLTGEIHWAIIGYTLIGSLAVFFFFNVFGKKQKIFMGDTGSLLLGYILSAFVFHFCEINAYHVVDEHYVCYAAPMICICVLSIPLFDTIRVMFTRIKNHRSPFSPDKNHIHHLLLRGGLTHLQTTMTILSLTIVFIALAIIGRNWNNWILFFTDFALCMCFTWVIWRLVDKNSNQTKKQ